MQVIPTPPVFASPFPCALHCSHSDDDDGGDDNDDEMHRGRMCPLCSWSAGTTHSYSHRAPRTSHDLLSTVTRHDLLSTVTVHDLLSTVTRHDLLSTVTVRDFLSTVTAQHTDLQKIQDIRKSPGEAKSISWNYPTFFQPGFLSVRLRTTLAGTYSHL